MKKRNEIESHREEISTVFNRPSGFWVKSGMLLVFMFIMIVVAFSSFIKYPTAINCNLFISKGAQQYTIEGFNHNGEIVYSAFPSKETHLTVIDTVLFIEAEQPEKLYARIILSSIYEKELKLRKELKIIVTKQPLESKLIHAKISSVYRSFGSGDIVINVEIPDMDSDIFSETLQSKEAKISSEIILDEKTVFMRIFSKIKSIV